MIIKKGGIFNIFIILIIILVLVVPVQAFVHHSVENLWQRLTNQVEEELDRTRVGRELNRIIEDVENVAHIVEEVQGLVTLAASATPAGAIVTLAIQYDHDPDQLFERFQDRVHSLENNNPGGGGGSNGQLSETEVAAALQSVLEEPPLPDGVYMGGSCTIDFTNCRDESESRQPRYRASYWDYSCYVQGVIDKKKINGLNKAVCRVNWINPWGRNRVEVKFPVDQAFATYDWERCPRVLLTNQEQRQFLTSRNNVCNQPIAEHDLGDVCAVDYTSCSYGSSARSNANRIGTINYGEVINNNFGFRREYACEVAYGNFALKRSLRDSCATVYSGEIEVNEFLARNPEQVMQQTQQIPLQQQQPISQAMHTNPIQVPGFSNRMDVFLARNLGEVPAQAEPQQPRIVYSENSTVDITPITVQQKREITEARLQTLNAISQFDVNKIKKSVEGKALPEQFKKYFGNEHAEINIRRNYGKDLLLCAVVDEGIVKEFDICSVDFKPTIKLETSESMLKEIKSVKDIANALNNGKINYQAIGLKNKIKFGIAISILKQFD